MRRRSKNLFQEILIDSCLQRCGLLVRGGPGHWKIRFVVLALFWAFPVFAVSFDEFGVEPYDGQIAMVASGFDDPAFSKLASEALAKPINFAGHYIVFHYSCGGGCITGAVMDAITGKYVADFPDNYISGDDPETFRSEFRRDSRLIRLEGKSAYGGEDVKREYFEFVDGDFKSLPSN